MLPPRDCWCGADWANRARCIRLSQGAVTWMVTKVPGVCETRRYNVSSIAMKLSCAGKRCVGTNTRYIIVSRGVYSMGRWAGFRPTHQERPTACGDQGLEVDRLDMQLSSAFTTARCIWIEFERESAGNCSHQAVLYCSPRSKGHTVVQKW